MSPEREAAVQFERVTMSFRRPREQARTRVLRDVDLAVAEREFTSIVGPSGCGKSTLLNLCAGLLRPDAGRVLVEGAAVAGFSRRVGYVTQDANLLPWVTVLENVMVPLEIRGVPRDQRRRRALEQLEKVGLAGFEHHYPHQLSGGMQKRCSIARTLVHEPDVILMDEPFGPLDAITRLVLQDELLKLWEERRQTVVFITHDLTEAISLSDRVIVMSRRPATVKQVVAVDLPRPRNVFTITGAPGFAEIQARLWSAVQPEIEELGAEARGGQAV
jgi:NitT/TauT family transport system ATP-binding protein